MSKKVLFVSLFIIIATATIYLYFQYHRLNIITGYTAKEVCSCTFISNRNIDVIDNEDTGFSPIKLANFTIDLKERSVTSSVFGLQKRKAYFHDGYGCVLDNDNIKSNNDIEYQSFKNSSSISVVDWPNGEETHDSLFVPIDYKQLQSLVSSIFDQKNPIKTYKTRSLMIIYKDHIIAEQYANGFDRQTPMIGWSMTKSILNTLVGILVKTQNFDIHKGALFQEWEDDKRSKITTDDLLQMNSGLDWVEDYDNMSDVTKMLFTAADVSKIQLYKSASFLPRTHWNYSSGTSNLISSLIRKQFDTHQQYLSFPHHYLFEKLGMNSMVLETDMVGNYIGSSYSFASTIDWAKLGMLYLHDGIWKGERILPEGWVNYTITPTPTSDQQYGSHFWLNAGSRLSDVPKDMFAMEGYHGQRVFIIPSKDLVIVRTGFGSLRDEVFNELIKGIIEALP